MGRLEDSEREIRAALRRLAHLLAIAGRRRFNAGERTEAADLIFTLDGHGCLPDETLDRIERGKPEGEG